MIMLVVSYAVYTCMLLQEPVVVLGLGGRGLVLLDALGLVEFLLPFEELFLPFSALLLQPLLQPLRALSPPPVLRLDVRHRVQEAAADPA
jgi:hypothetical protein